MKKTLLIFLLLSTYNVILSQTNDQEAQVTYQLAQEEYDNNNFSKAIEYLDKVEKLSEQAKAKTSYLKTKCYEKQLFHIDNLPGFRNILNNYGATEQILTSNYSSKDSKSNYNIDYSPYQKCLNNAIYYINNGKDEDKKTELLRLKIKIENSDEYNLVQATELYNQSVKEAEKGHHKSVIKLLNEAKNICKIKPLFYNPLLPAELDKENNFYPNFVLDMRILRAKLIRYDCDEIKITNNISELAKKLNLKIPYRILNDEGWLKWWKFDDKKALITGDYKNLASKFTSTPFETQYGEITNLDYLYYNGDLSYIKEYGQKSLFSTYSQKNDKDKYCDKIHCFTEWELRAITDMTCKALVKEKNQRLAEKYVMRCFELSEKLKFKSDSIYDMRLYSFFDQNKTELLLSEYMKKSKKSLYQAACIASLINKQDLAFDYLEQYFSSILDSKDERGYYIFYNYQRDYDFENIRNDPRFMALLKKYYPEKF